MTTRDKCQCWAKCRFTAEPGEPYALRHDPRPERAEARSALMRELGLKGGSSTSKKRAKAFREAVNAAHIPLETPEQIQAYIAQEAGRARVSGDSRILRVAVQLAAVAKELIPLAAMSAENAALRAFIADKHPEAKPMLYAVDKGPRR